MAAAKKKTTTKKTKTAAKKKTGRPKNIDSPDYLMEVFLKYQEEEGEITVERVTKDGRFKITKMAFISIQGFIIWINKNKDKYKKICRATWYQMRKQEMFLDTIKEIEAILEEHILQAVMRGDIEKTVTIFYMKNKFGYRDRFENINYNTDTDIDTVKQLTDEQIDQMLEEGK